MLANLKSASMDAVNTVNLVPIVVKIVLQKEQEFEGAALTVKPYEEIMKKDNQDYEVFRNWWNGFYNFS